MNKRILDLAKNGLMYFSFRLTRQFRYLGWPVVFHWGVEIENSSTVTIGNFSNIGKDTWIRSASNKACEGVIIGTNVSIGRRCFISCADKISIGNNCVFGPNVTVVDNNHAYTDLSKPISAQGISSPIPVSIGPDCWIGTNAVILPGSHIGKHCIIGANSVVSGKVPDYSVLAGIPGKIVKKYDQKLGKWIKKLR